MRGTPVVRDPALVKAFREVLVTAGFETERLKAILGGTDDSLRPPRDRLPFLVRAMDDSALTSLVSLFFFGFPVSVQNARRALAPLSLADAQALGILAAGREQAHGTVKIAPVRDLLFSWDKDFTLEQPADYVMGITPSTQLAEAITIRRHAALALDLGTGCGYQAIMAARHSDKVIATDVNARALRFTAFNALLNGLDNVECRTGEWFAPVEGLSFDLVMCNPPYVVSPDRTLVYRDGGLERDAVSRLVLQTVPRFLVPGGTAQLQISWVHEPEGDWSAPLREWVEGHGCDAWFLRHTSFDPMAYAVYWNSKLQDIDTRRYLSAVDAWTRYYETNGIRALSIGGAILRRRDGEARLRADDLPSGDPLPFDAGAVLETLLVADDRLAMLEDEALLAEPLAVAPQHRIDQRLEAGGGDIAVRESVLSVGTGLRPRVALDGPELRLLGALDGRRTLGDAAALAQFDRPRAVALSRSLISKGLLRFARPGTEAPAP